MTPVLQLCRVLIGVAMLCLADPVRDVCGGAVPALDVSLRPPVELSFAAGADSLNPFFSSDSRFLFFQSFANDLVADDSDAQALDLFRYEVSSGVLSRVSQGAATEGASADWMSPMVSGDGNSLVFVSSGLGLDSRKTDPRVMDVFWKDLKSGETRLLTLSTNGVGGGDFDSSHPVISDDGQMVAFESLARNLGGYQNALGGRGLYSSIVVANLRSNALELINPSSVPGRSFGNAIAPSLSRDGRRMAFVSDGLTSLSPIARVFVRDNLTGSLVWSGTNHEVSSLQLGRCLAPQMSPDGRWVGFVRPRSPGEPTLVMHDIDANQDYILETNLLSCLPVIHSADDRVLFERAGQPIIWDPIQARLESLSISVDTSVPPAPVATYVSADAAFKRFAHVGRLNRGGTKRINSYPQAFVWDRETGRDELVSGTAEGLPGSQQNLLDPVISPDGRWVAFQASDSDIVDGDRNRSMDVFLHDLQTHKTLLVSHRVPEGKRSTTLALLYGRPSIAGDGRSVAFAASDGETVTGDTNTSIDVFLLNSVNGGRRMLSPAVDPDVQSLRRHLEPQISANGHSIAFLALYQAPGGSSPLSTRLYHSDAETSDLRLISSLVRTRTDDFTLHRSPPIFSLSADGQWIAYESVAVPGTQIVVEDLASKTNFLASLNTNAVALGYTSTAPWVSSNGSRVLFLSDGAGFAAEPVNQLTGVQRLFLRDLKAGVTHALSYRSDEQVNLAKTDSIHHYVVDGAENLVAFHLGQAEAETPGGAWFADLNTYTNRQFPQIQVIFGLSRDGRYAVGRHHPLSPLGSRGLCRLDTLTGEIIPFETGPRWGPEFRSNLNPPIISGDGRFIVFELDHAGLRPMDSNHQVDLFVRDVEAGVTLLLSANRRGTGPGNGPSSSPMLAPDGRTVWFSSWASDLVSGDFNASRDFFQAELSAEDSDQDGLADDWEYAYFNNLSRNGSGDFDGDGQTDAEEYRAGTSPIRGESVLRVITLRRSGDSEWRVLWSAVPGKTYAIERRGLLSDGSWQQIGSVTALTTTGDWTDADSSGSGQRYYRIVVDK